MLTKTEGIVFRKIPYSETSIIADIYTREHGLMSYIVGGVRKAKARTSASLLQLMSIIEIVAYHSEKRKLHRIKEVKPAYVFQSIPLDVKKNAVLLFLAEVCSKTIREPEPNDALFEMILGYLRQLDTMQSGYGGLHLEFMIALADQLGFGPALNYSEVNRGFDMVGGEFTARHPVGHMHYLSDAGDLAALIRQTRSGGEIAKLDRSRRNDLLDSLIVYFRIHLDNLREIRSHTILREVL